MRSFWTIVILLSAAPVWSAPLKDPSPAAFQNALMSRLSSNGLGNLVSAGEFYCVTKRSLPYDTARSYEQNATNAVGYASARWSSRERGRSRSTDQIGAEDAAMMIADRHLCPGWPNHPAPRGWVD